MKHSAHIVEVFSSIQGEGIYVGRRQLFVRFAGCNLACAYCDTPESRVTIPSAQVETGAASGKFRKMGNPFSVEALAQVIAGLDSGRLHDSVCLTGGEPLLSAEFIGELVTPCEGRRFYLETNGTLPRELQKIVHLVQTVAMDIKLASATGQSSDLSVSREFLSIASCRDVFVKAIVSAKTTESEIEEAAKTVAAVNREIPFVIQPLTPVKPGMKPPSASAMLKLQAAALRLLADVRVIPQVHKLMGQK